MRSDKWTNIALVTIGLLLLFLCLYTLVRVSNKSNDEIDAVEVKYTANDYLDARDKCVTEFKNDSIYRNMDRVVFKVVCQDLIKQNPSKRFTKQEIVRQYIENVEKYNNIARGYNIWKDEIKEDSLTEDSINDIE